VDENKHLESLSGNGHRNGFALEDKNVEIRSKSNGNASRVHDAIILHHHEKTENWKGEEHGNCQMTKEGVNANCRLLRILNYKPTMSHVKSIWHLTAYLDC
jgi:hypothetical protein